jgi:hypothetical protein
MLKLCRNNTYRAHGKDVTKNIKIFTYTFIKKLRNRDLSEGMRNNNKKLAV